MRPARTLGRLAALLGGAAALLASPATPAARADYRVEVIGRVDYNGLSFNVCLGPPCPFRDVRAGEYVHMTFRTAGVGRPGTIFPCPGGQTPDVRGFDIRDGSLLVRAGGVTLSAPVGGTPWDPVTNPNGLTQPFCRLDHMNCAVDVLSVEGVILGRGGRCCFPNGACLFIAQPDCAGQWSQEGTCNPNPCPQPLGVCCAPDDSCTATLASACAGVWSAGGGCAPGACPQVVGACCLTDGSCAQTTAPLCGGAWSQATACAAAACPRPGLLPDYACDVILGQRFVDPPRTPMWVSADIGQNLGSYPESLLNEHRSWTIIFQDYEMFVNIEKFVFSDDTVAMGSCCPGDGQCLVTSRTACPLPAWAAGGTCTPTTCPSSSGACCSPAGACQLLTPAGCAAIAGSVYLLDGTTCTTSVCPPVGACCTGGSCSRIIESACLSSSGTYLGDGSVCTVGPQYTQPVNLNVPDATFNSAGDIPGAPLTSTITLGGPGTVSSVEAWLDVSTGRVNDFRATLTGPNGATVPLFTRIGAKPPACTATPVGPGASLFGLYSFRDSAPTTLHAAALAAILGNQPGAVTPAAYKASDCGGTFVSLNGAFASSPIAGDWTLTVVDQRSGSTLTLRSWGLSFNGGNPSPCAMGRCDTASGCAASVAGLCTGVWSLGTCTPPSCGPSQPGACCYLGACAVVCQSSCPAGAGASFLGAGAACGPSSCLATCCLSDGSCVLGLPDRCAGVAGGANSVCVPASCTQPGRCCSGVGICVVAPASACPSGFTGGAPGSVCTPNTCPNQPAPPANDQCANAAVVTLTANTYTSSGMTLAGASPDGVSPSCGTAGSPDAWFQFTPPATSTYFIGTCSSSTSWDTTVSVWTGCGTQLAGACADDTCGTSPTVYGHASMNVQLTAGVPYRIRVAAFAPTTTGIGAYTLTVSTVGACCFTTGACNFRAASACVGTSFYAFLGAGTSCSPDPCPKRAPCCNGAACTYVLTVLCNGVAGSTTQTCVPNPCFIRCCVGSTCLVQNVACTAPGGSLRAGAASAGAGTACNAPDNTRSPCCLADYNKLNNVDLLDIFDFLTDWFNGSPFTDHNGNGNGASDLLDIFSFLQDWFAGPCP